MNQLEKADLRKGVRPKSGEVWLCVADPATDEWIWAPAVISGARILGDGFDYPYAACKDVCVMPRAATESERAARMVEIRAYVPEGILS